MERDHENQNELDLDQALLEFMRRFDSGKLEDRSEFLARYPQLKERLSELLDTADWIEELAGPTLFESRRNLQAIDSDESFPPVDPNDVTIALELPANFNPSTPGGQGDSTLPPPKLRGNTSRRDPVRSSNPNAPFQFSSLPNLDNTQATLPCRFGEYVLEAVLGRGGMGVVYLANQTSLSRQVAVKMIRSGALATDDEVSRFYAEARSAGSLMHPSIITIYHCGELEGHHYFSMDYVPGTDLAKKLSDGPMKAREAVRYVRDVALAIEYAHSRGVVHRDLKPANVLITPDDEVVLTDFGLAKQMGAEDGLTATGAALGTPSYMSPEQAAGKSEEQGASTDVYAMGAILYALLVGKPPFQGETILQTMMAVMNRPATNIRSIRPDVHPDLETIVHKCLEKSPARRYATAHELAHDLECFYQGAPITARPPSMLRKFKHWVAHVPIIAALSGTKNVEPTPSQRTAQRLILGTLLACMLSWFLGPAAFTFIRDNSFPRHVTIASGSPGGMYYQFAGQISTELEQETGVHPNVIPTKGSLDNYQQLKERKVQLAIIQESSILSGEVAVVAPLFYEAVHILVKDGTGIQNMEQIRGKKVMIGTKSSGSRQAASRILSYFGVSFDDLELIDGDWFQKELRVSADVVIVVVKVGQQGVREMLQEEGFSILPISDAASLALSEPMFRLYEIRQSEYGITNSQNTIQTLATTALLVARRDAPARLVTEALQAIYRGENGTPAITGFMPIEMAANWQGLSYHEAARKFYAGFEKTIDP